MAKISFSSSTSLHIDGITVTILHLASSSPVLNVLGLTTFSSAVPSQPLLCPIRGGERAKEKWIWGPGGRE